MASSKLKLWADSVKARDGKCMDCGSFEDLHAHHIKPKSAHPELMLDVSNGKTLCYRCHKAEHERNRPVRVRSNKPQRRTLEAQIAHLRQQINTKDAIIRTLKNSPKTPITREQLGRLLNHNPALLEQVRASILECNSPQY